MRNVSDKTTEKIKKIIFNSVFLENHEVYENVENVLQPEVPQVTVHKGACALYCGYLSVQRHTRSR
jgi:hypothetical protein